MLEEPESRPARGCVRSGSVTLLRSRSTGGSGPEEPNSPMSKMSANKDGLSCTGASERERTPSGTAAASAKGTGSVRTSSARLFGEASEVQIEHGGALYRLRRTSKGKLILTK